MDPTPQAPPPLPAHPAPAPGVMPAPVPHVIHVVAKPGGFSRAIGFVLGLMLFIAVLVAGIVIGLAAGFLGGAAEGLIVRSLYRDGGSSRVAVIPISGPIDESMSAFVRAAVDDVLADRNVRAVVLRVDSPGGGVTASDQVWYEVERLKSGRGGQRIPVVASFGGIAASGGYYVACSADHIMAQTTTITGSIGVIAQVLTFESLFEKVGIAPVTLVATGSPEKDVANNVYRGWTEEDRASVQVMLDAAYATFHERVRAGRGGALGSDGRIDAIADGTVFTAQQALDNGLVDGLGYLDDAIAEAERRGGLRRGSATVEVLYWPTFSFVDFLMARSPAPRALDAESARSFVTELSAPRVMYLMQ